jgi:hypothetical protein
MLIWWVPTIGARGRRCTQNQPTSTAATQIRAANEHSPSHRYRTVCLVITHHNIPTLTSNVNVSAILSLLWYWSSLFAAVPILLDRISLKIKHALESRLKLRSRRRICTPSFHQPFLHPYTQGYTQKRKPGAVGATRGSQNAH